MKSKIVKTVLFSLLLAAVFYGCDQDFWHPEKDDSSGGGTPQTPIASDYDISGTGNRTFTGSPFKVTITRKSGKSPGNVTVYYNTSTTEPSDVGSYTITFDVAAASGWYSASGLNGGTLIIFEGEAPTQTPGKDDYNITGLSQTFNGTPREVSIVAKTGKSPGTITILYDGSATAPTAVGSYTVTFNVAAATGWDAVSRLSAGTLVISASTSTVTLNDVKANGSTSVSTDALTLYFSATITGLSAADISLTGVSGVTNGALTGPVVSGSSITYTLGITGFTAGGDLTVSVSKGGYSIDGSPKRNVRIYYTAPTTPVTSVTLNRNTLELEVGGTGTLTATITPTNATNKAVTWSSNNTAVATVSSGTITAVAAGSATITVTTVDGNKTATCAVTVNAAPIIPANLASHLSTLSINNASTAHTILLKVSSTSEFTTISSALTGAPNKYVKLDLSSSNITSIPMRAFNPLLTSSSACITLIGIILPNSVTSIGDSAFQDCTGITNVTLPDSVTRIGDQAFTGCTNLTSITFGNSFISIGFNAFTYCNSLTSINVASGNNTYSSENGVLYSKDRKTLIMYPLGKKGHFTIPNSVNTIGFIAVAYCKGISSVTIPNSVTKIEELAFIGCTDLTSVTFQGTILSSEFSSEYKPFDGDLREKFYERDSSNGTPGTYTRPSGSSTSWTKQ